MGSFHHVTGATMKFTSTLSRPIGAALTVLSLCVLVACGGGSGGSASEAVPPTNVTPPTEAPTAVSGTITGFGSVIIDGVKFDDSKTSVAMGTNPAATTAGTLTDLKLGMRVEGTVKNGVMTDLVVQASLIGPIGAVNVVGSTLTVYGQTVTVLSTGATPTAYEGVAGLSGLALSDVVEVHGTVDANKRLTATRVERKPQGDLAKGVRLGGLVAQLDNTAKTFKFNDLTVDYSAANLLPTGSTPANGAMAVVYADAAPVAGVLRAKALKLERPEQGSHFGIGGRINVFVSAAQFNLGGIRVDASAATFEGGTAADLAAGVSVGVEGTVTGEVLKADKVRIFKAPVDVKASLAGQVTDWLSATSFKVRGQMVDASNASFVGGAANDLGAGAWLVVSGKVQGETLLAEKIEFKAPPTAKLVTLKGEVRDLDLTAMTFKFLGVTLKLGDGAVWEGGSLTQLVNGRRVEITGTANAEGVVIVSKVAVLTELLTPPAVVLGGHVSDRTDTGFKLPGASVTFTNATVFEGGVLADVGNGVQVLVKGKFNSTNRTLAATWVEIIKVEANVPRVAGAVSEFTTLSNFRIGGQKVDASSAVFVDSTAADVKVGALVEAVGSVSTVGESKVLVATKLRVLSK
jgi:Domain of unknown function (DUF5666)